jgi:hypothetical protein
MGAISNERHSSPGRAPETVSDRGFHRAPEKTVGKPCRNDLSGKQSPSVQNQISLPQLVHRDHAMILA